MVNFRGTRDIPLDVALILGGKESEVIKKPKVNENPAIYIYSNYLGVYYKPSTIDDSL